MRQPPENLFDVATVLSVGRRDCQEDALETVFPEGEGYGYAILCDGMGGHAAGEVAANLVLSSVAEDLRAGCEDLETFSEHITDVLETATETANGLVRSHARANPEARGMGTTLVATVILQDLLYWVSVGDSPLYLFRNRMLQQLNEDHSMAPQIDLMVEKGMMAPEVGANHPQRCLLTSVIIGRQIERVDCPHAPFRLEAGDVLILSSDGLQFLTDQQIATILGAAGSGPAQVILEMLMGAIERLDHPDQDNVSVAVIRYGGAAASDAAQETAWEDEHEAEAMAANALAGHGEKSSGSALARALAGRFL